MKPCICGHDKKYHIDFCVNCNCKEFSTVSNRSTTVGKSVVLTGIERSIIANSLKRNVANIDTDLFLKLLEKMK